ncbi:hypothetical protein HO173_010753 [Letharia columbiana]|uniref:Uncharacterized protein n=1 Tax=Letharia columbiana TaxID=112416 RepID=A0A8H6FM53_9LECA|nr:uncharacterized protein HO173_010753 [Letharia columbiana]KAF6231053.1 hypothetical protein HO173_010753 [Letharia columbiana]
MIISQPRYNASSLTFQLNTSARVDELPRNWNSPSSPDSLEQTCPIYAAAEDDIYTSVFSRIWIQYLNNESVSPITVSSMIGFNPAQVNQPWRTLACTFQNTTYSLNVIFENGISSINTTMISSAPMSIVGPIDLTEPTEAQYLDPATALFSSLAGSIYGETSENSM